MHSKSATNLVRNELDYIRFNAGYVDNVNVHNQCRSLLDVSHSHRYHRLLGRAHLARSVNVDSASCRNR